MTDRTPWADAPNRRAGALQGRARQQRNERIKRRDHHTCQLCGGQRCGNLDLEVDHIDGDHTNDTPTNLRTVGARPCHLEQTQRQAAAGRARTSTKRPTERHPGLVDPA